MSAAAVLPLPADDSALTLCVGGRSVIDRTLATLLAVPDVARIVVAPQRAPCEELRAVLHGAPPLVRVLGLHRGRPAALRRALLVAGPVDRVLVHHSDLPLTAAAELEALLALLDQSPCAVLGVPVKSTIKMARDGVIEGTLPREQLCYATGPRAFRREALERALGERGEVDEMAAARRAGLPVAVMRASAASCLRIAGPGDVELAEALLTCGAAGPAH